jgi:hypothetical protein
MQLFVCHCTTVSHYVHTYRTGLRPTAFPPGVPVYSGHFHKPHTVGGSSSSSSSSSSNNSGSIIAGTSSSSSSSGSSSSSESSISSNSGDVVHCGVRYIGSPYQTGIAEAGQEKELLILSSSSSSGSSSSSSSSRTGSSASSSNSSWTVLETVPIRLGKRYFRVRGDAQVSGPC